MYELRKDNPTPELEQAALDLLDAGHLLDAPSLCTGEEALASHALGKRLCDATDAEAVPETVATFCGR